MDKLLLGSIDDKRKIDLNENENVNGIQSIYLFIFFEKVFILVEEDRNFIS